MRHAIIHRRPLIRGSGHGWRRTPAQRFRPAASRVAAVARRRVQFRPQAALTLVEAVISMVIVSVMLIAALNTVGASRQAAQKTGDRGKGMLLAQQLMSEILRQSYADPLAGPGNLGLELGEIGDGSRALWNDIDDYLNWSAAPPQYKDGTAVPNLEDWGRASSVVWADPNDVELTRFYETYVKRIVVTVTHNDAVVAELMAVRTLAHDNMESR